RQTLRSTSRQEVPLENMVRDEGPRRDAGIRRWCALAQAREPWRRRDGAAIFSHLLQRSKLLPSRVELRPGGRPSKPTSLFRRDRRHCPFGTLRELAEGCSR